MSLRRRRCRRCRPRCESGRGRGKRARRRTAMPGNPACEQPREACDGDRAWPAKEPSLAAEFKPRAPRTQEQSAAWFHLQSQAMHYRSDNRSPAQMRPVNIMADYIKTAEGSVLLEVGNTRVICTASVDEAVPPFLRNSGKGWISSEYSMLPRSTLTRSPREVTKGRPSGRTHEIQRLIGRSLRAVTDLERLGERTIWIDCDVIQADGGTRT